MQSYPLLQSVSGDDGRRAFSGENRQAVLRLRAGARLGAGGRTETAEPADGGHYVLYRGRIKDQQRRRHLFLCLCQQGGGGPLWVYGGRVYGGYRGQCGGECLSAGSAEGALRLRGGVSGWRSYLFHPLPGALQRWKPEVGDRQRKEVPGYVRQMDGQQPLSGHYAFGGGCRADQGAGTAALQYLRHGSLRNHPFCTEA